ncbi:hypothetical protein PsW64_01901 [Pseudovibrio sp. W64]|uniref:hypothetical protein n=1 Tax=unclassified Pseudovibrio TaxID=2627060 RepID=UPI0007AE9A5B|nr:MULTISPECIES: hypothetical protein [unclassified Pseudovibrio]KZK81456.1 hypothetical protein PsAD13_04408 [Pseudovibrio sp. Ad13]KZK83735.1 hypothetical protein PsW64_01901 [Pseudovibrio sp. W64]KZK93255.1 hypothetical protein PsW74_05411 [Pseudovibrio sp. W74]KZL07146.1 hypothetical protein PsAD14_04614 [Pseudovibrio sp. Ad14]
MSTAANGTSGAADAGPQKVTVTPGPEFNSALDDAVVQLTKVKQNVDQAASEFAQLRQGIPNYNEVVAEIRQQQAQINRACDDATSSAQTIVSEVEQAAAKLCTSIDEEITTIKSVIGTGDEEEEPQSPPAPPPAQPQPQMVPGQGGPQAGPGMAQFPGSGLPGQGGVPNQEAMAVQAAEAMRDFLKKEIKSELSRQIAPLNEKLSELLISYLQQRTRDR